jgi:hypothetical protein
MLLRYARPTARELEGRPNLLDLRNGIADEADLRKAREARLRRDLAIHRLMVVWHDAKTRGQLGQLPTDIRFFVERLIRENDGKRPRLRIGRPRDPRHSLRRILICLKLQEELTARKPPPRKLQDTLKDIAKNLNITSEETGGVTIRAVSYQEVREIYYDRSPEFQDAVKGTVAMRELLNEARASCRATEAIASDDDLS